MKNKETDSYIREIEAMFTSLGLKVIRKQKTGFSITTSKQEKALVQKGQIPNGWVSKYDKIYTKYGLKNTLEKGTGFFIMPSQRPIKSNNKKRITIEQLKILIETKIDDKALSQAILIDLEKNPNDYEQYLKLENPIPTILADWY